MKAKRLYFALITFLFIIFIVAIRYQQTRQVEKVRPIEQLLERLSDNYQRRLDVNKYSISYQIKEPDTIMINVRYYRDVNRKNMNDALDSAKSMIRGMARDNYGIEAIPVRYEVDMTEVEQ